MRDSNLSSSSSHHQNQHLKQPFPNAELRDVAWALDSITDGTGGESMRIATVRQLSRALGAVLAECTDNKTEAKERLAEVQERTKGVNNYADLLNMTVGVIAQAPDLDTATASVVQAWKELAQQNGILTDKLLQGLVATTKESCKEMLQQLLLPPNGGALMNQSMDGTIQTVFGAKGDVERISIQAIGGRFSLYLAKALAEADAKYQDEKQRIREAGGDPGPIAPEVAAVSLTMNWRGYNRAIEKENEKKPADEQIEMKPDYECLEFKLTSADFMKAYIDATFEYAAVAYADRWRKEMGR